MTCGPYVVTLLKWTRVFERYMAKFVVRNIHTHTPKQNDKKEKKKQKESVNEIGLCALKI